MAAKIPWYRRLPWPWIGVWGIGFVILIFLWGAWSKGRQSPRATVPRQLTPPVAVLPTPVPAATPVMPLPKLVESATTTATSTPVVSTATRPTLPSAPPAVAPAKDTLVVAVRNGSGEAGVAGRVAEQFRGAGYGRVTAGNADTYAYRGVTIKHHTGLRGAAEDLARILRDRPGPVTFVEFATSSERADVVVIIGQ